MNKWIKKKVTDKLLLLLLATLESNYLTNESFQCAGDQFLSWDWIFRGYRAANCGGTLILFSISKQRKIVKCKIYLNLTI